MRAVPAMMPGVPAAPATLGPWHGEEATFEILEALFNRVVGAVSGASRSSKEAGGQHVGIVAVIKIA
jgi:hypothetical protein